MWPVKLLGPLALPLFHFLLAVSQESGGFRQGNFVKHASRYLNASLVGASPVLSPTDCAFACLEKISCSSFNLQANPGVGGKLLCELSAADKYNASDNFQVSLQFDHYSKTRCASSSPCKNGGLCVDDLLEDEDFRCECRPGFGGKTCDTALASCSKIKSRHADAANGSYLIDPDGPGDLAPFSVLCDMSDKGGVGVTVIGHDSEARTLVDGCDPPGCYSRDVKYNGASLAQLASLTNVSSHCEQFIKYECVKSRIYRGNISWLVSRDGRAMWYWGGAPPGSNKCACGVNNACAGLSVACNCDMNDYVWREDNGLLTYKDDLPVSQLRFGDTGHSSEQGYHTLGKLRCYGAV